MTQRVLLQAVMVDGTIIRDEARTFEAFSALALGFRSDRDVARLTWTVLLEGSASAAEELREAGVWPARPVAADVA